AGDAGGVAEAEREQAGGGGIERAGVAHPLHPQQTANAPHDVEGGGTCRRVDEQHPGELGLLGHARLCTPTGPVRSREMERERESWMENGRHWAEAPRAAG